MTQGPTRATTLPENAAERKQYPLASGLFDYFADALAAVAHVSWKGNEQHNPGTPVHWDRSKSTDEADTMLRHFAERGSRDTDGLRHSAKMAWRALAFLQKEIEGEGDARYPLPPDPVALLKIGDTDPLFSGTSPVCRVGAGLRGYSCTRGKDHSGVCIACGPGGRIIAIGKLPLPASEQ